MKPRASFAGAAVEVSDLGRSIAFHRLWLPMLGFHRVWANPDRVLWSRGYDHFVMRQAKDGISYGPGALWLAVSAESRGQVDQGASANKGMRLQETLTTYSDSDAGITYDTNTDAGLPELDMQLKGIPTGTLDGTLVGTYGMTGALKGEVALNVAFSGALEANDAGGVERKPGSTHITGTATSGSGVYQIDLTR